MRILKRIFDCLIAVTVCVSMLLIDSCSGKEDPQPKEPEYADVQGFVTNQVGVKVEGATVTMGTRASITDAQGHYRISGLNPGKIQAKIEAEGCDLFTQDVNLKAGPDNSFDFTVFSYASVLKVSRNELIVEADASDTEFQVMYNSDWKVESDAGWIRPDKPSGKGNGVVVFHADASYESAERHATLIFTSERERIEVPVTQDYFLAVVSTSIKIGNEKDEIMDEIIVKLNKPVQKVYGVQALNPETCPYIEGMVAPDEVKLTGLFNLTEDISFLFEAKNNFGFVEDVVVDTHHYKNKIVPDLTPDESIVDIMLFNEGKEMLVWAYRVDKNDYHLLRVDIESGRTVMDCAFSDMLSFYHSLYDDKWYTWYENNLYTIDFETGNLTDVYSFESDDPNACTYISSIGILSDGTGIVNLHCSSSSGISWCFIDTRGGEITTEELSFEERSRRNLPNRFSICTNFDASRLYLGSGSRFFIYELGNPDQFRVHSAPYHSTVGTISPHAGKDLVYVSSGGNNYPMDSEWHITLPVHGRWVEGGMGFCYDPGMDDRVFLKDGYEDFMIVRYNMVDGDQEVVATHPMRFAADLLTDPAGGKAYCFRTTYDQKKCVNYNAVYQFETAYLNSMAR